MRLLPAGLHHGDHGAAGKTPNPTDAEIDAAITNLCRCGTYPPCMRAAIKRAAELTKAGA